MAIMAAGGIAREMVVTCLCAEWCGVCRDYRKGFFALAERFPAVRFEWLDIEYDAEKIGELEVEDFPTLLIERAGSRLFCGVMPPQPEHLSRMVEKLTSEKP